MKIRQIIICILTVVFLSSCVRLNPEYAHKEDKFPQYRLSELSDANINNWASDTNCIIYRMDDKVFDNIIARSDKEYFLIYSCRYYCTSEDCLFIDTLLKDFNSVKLNIQPIIITEGNYTDKPIVKMFYSTRNYLYPTFMLDIYKYGYDRREDKELRQLSFLMDVCPQTKLEELDNAFLLLNRNKEIVLEGKYKGLNREKVKRLLK